MQRLRGLLQGKRLKKTLLGTLGATALGAGAYDYRGDQRATRSIRCVFAAAVTIFDMKLLYSDDTADILHERNALRWYNVCCANSGLYIKLGQSIAMMNHILPPQYLELFNGLHDKAPSVSYDEVRKIFLQDFGKEPTEVFKEFSPAPIASASIAQVHKATKWDGTEVAVKVQKPYIMAQLPWDLWLYDRIVLLYEKCFDLPVYWTVEPIVDSMMKECDFLNEGRFTEKARDNLEPGSKSYVPEVHWDCTRPRVLCMEWIDGVKITDKEGMRDRCLDVKRAMTEVIRAFSHQLFVSGFLHADPHPGNMLIRKNPLKPTDVQVVLLDHGMYQQQSESFRLQYCDLWKAMVLMDMDSVKELCASWGIDDFTMFASSQLMKPYRVQEKSGEVIPIHEQHVRREDVLALHTNSKERVANLLAKSSQVPAELVCVGRNLNILRGVNKALNSPVNRLVIMGSYAARGALTHNAPTVRELWKLNGEKVNVLVDADLKMYEANASLASALKRTWGVWRFEYRLWSLSVVHVVLSWWLWFDRVVLRRETRIIGVEEKLEESMATTFEEKLAWKVDLQMG